MMRIALFLAGAYLGMRLLAAAYEPLLKRMAKQGFAPPRQRARVNKLRLLSAWLRYAAV